MKNLNLNCICGATWKGTLPKDAVWKASLAFGAQHCGEGHSLCDAETAARNRLKFEAEEAKAENGKS